MNNHGFDETKRQVQPEAYAPKRPAILDLAGAAKTQSRILPVRKVGFIGNTNDDRSPESFPLPACMASLMETLGEGYGDITIYAHNRSYTKRLANHAFLGASGMAFSLLWSDAYDPRTMDVSLTEPLSETVRRIFAFAGYTYDLFIAGDYNKDTVYREILHSIDAGKPVIMFGLFQHSECAIIAGYEDLGGVLLGWSHFQGEGKVETADNGMFRISDWDDSWTSIVILREKTERTFSYRDALKNGLAEMRKTEACGYAAGAAAFDAWISAVSQPEVSPALCRYHTDILFNYAELRAWGSDFLRDAGLESAADAFMQIHDLCWQADAAACGEQGFALLENRRKVAEILGQMASLDKKVESMIAEYINK